MYTYIMRRTLPNEARWVRQINLRFTFIKQLWYHVVGVRLLEDLLIIITTFHVYIRGIVHIHSIEKQTQFWTTYCCAYMVC
jgi:hypothetical protein